MSREGAARSRCRVTEGGRIKWCVVIDQAREIVESYDTPVTLRQLFYRLVAAQVVENKLAAYQYLSRKTAELRRAGTFPELIDHGRGIHEFRTFADPQDALEYTADVYRRDRTEGQAVSLYLAVEKAGLVAQLETWFGDLGVPILALGGYASQSFVDETCRHVAKRSRPAILLYGGDHDPSGWDIPRDFAERTDCWKAVHRVALTPELIADHDLPESFGKETDSRKTGFVRRFGRLVQVELDALPPTVLRQLYADSIADYWDDDMYTSVLDREGEDRAALDELARRWSA